MREYSSSSSSSIVSVLGWGVAGGDEGGDENGGQADLIDDAAERARDNPAGNNPSALVLSEFSVAASIGP